MNGWTVAGLFCGFIVGMMFANGSVKKSLIRCAGAGVVVINGIAYTVTPLKKEE